MQHQTPGSVESLARVSLALANEVLTHAARTPETPQEILTLGDLALLLRVSEPAVRQLVARGDIPGRLIGSEWRFLRSTVLNWLSGVDCGRRVRQPGGWVEDGSFPKDEWRTSVAAESWGEVASVEAEEFIKRMRTLRKQEVENPSQKDEAP
ncbi:helix-turn-helix domain-containing protein [Gemmata sp.]|uniref:helix-turn-helix domain-containing protein n=1 Tax=Gemmata sp. TaxID=1914242 RepID=UPI003F6FA93F